MGISAVRGRAATLASMNRLWLLAFVQVGTAAALRLSGHVEASGLALTLALWMLGWLAGDARSGGR
jgi:hypothetical protein